MPSKSKDGLGMNGLSAHECGPPLFAHKKSQNHGSFSPVLKRKRAATLKISLTHAGWFEEMIFHPAIWNQNLVESRWKVTSLPPFSFRK